jgi:hypothetical protein
MFGTCIVGGDMRQLGKGGDVVHDVRLSHGYVTP